MANPFVLKLQDLKNQSAANVATIFSQGNGSFGVQATDPLVASAGTIINGFYEQAPITYGETAYGYAKNHQTIIALPSLRQLQLADQAGRPAVSLGAQAVALDMATGILTAVYGVSFAAAEPAALTLTVRSLIGEADADLSAYLLDYQVKSLTYQGALTLTKPGLALAATAAATVDPDDPRVVDRGSQLTSATLASTAQTLTQTVTTQTSQLTAQVQMAGIGTDLRRVVQLVPGAQLELTYLAQLDFDPRRDLQPATAATVTALRQRTATYWRDFWAAGEVKISGDAQLDRGLHFNLYQLCQSANRTGAYSIAAKGVSGPGYEGHFFWDTEMYMLPFFTYTQPKIARALLKFRYQQLPQARQRAWELGVAAGALFPWRSINGQEASAFFPAGTAQYHLDADIAYAVGLYYETTLDDPFMAKYGLPILWETARFWQNFGAWGERDGQRCFMFHDVTGPDEYTALVDNNYYTNRLAKHNLELFLKYYPQFQDCAQLPVTAADLTALREIAAGIYLGFDQQRQLTPQDDTFLNKPLWPLASTPAANFPLLLHYHPLTIYRYQVNKQPDMLLTNLLFPGEKSPAQQARDYAYYEKVTTHDSSLSRSVFAVLAAQLGYDDAAYQYFLDSALLDLTDLQGNTKDGLHMANLGGSWLSVIYGFAGVSLQDGLLHINNHLPQKWSGLMFRLKIAGRQLQVQLTKDKTTVELLSGAPLEVVIAGQPTMIKAQADQS